MVEREREQEAGSLVGQRFMINILGTDVKMNLWILANAIHEYNNDAVEVKVILCVFLGVYGFHGTNELNVYSWSYVHLQFAGNTHSIHG